MVYYIQENNILCIIYKDDLDVARNAQKNLFSYCLIWRWRGFEQTLSLQKDGGFCKNTSIGTVVYNFIKRNEILQPNILIYFKAIFNVTQRTMIVRLGGDGGF